ncbi:MAG TPA: transketolase C-terminal domain-containing protein [Actinomycetota bacterium]|nr:transketolase C-terminal domain-containing protein [Actinomycetota bacterium]
MGKATREAFGEALVEVGSDPKHVVLDGDLMKSNFTYLFKEAYPERFVECGIAESNMVGVAAGLALSGKVAWASSFSCFIAGRLETVRMSVGYNEANVRIAGTHAGIGIGDDGASQMALEDVAAMRALPNMAVIQPCDEAETVAAVRYLADEHVGPAFLRLTRQKLDDVHGDGYAFEFGKVETLRDGSDVVLFGSGATVQEALRAADDLAGDGISARVVNVHTLAPLDAEGIVAAAEAGGRRAVSVEDHNVNGGLGSAVAEALAQAGSGTRLTILGCRDYGQSGSSEELYDAYGISAKHVAEAARALANA